MKVTSRNLPRLHQCYLQKKAYEIHRNKLSRATSSLSLPNRLISKHTKSLDKAKYQMTPIREYPKAEDPSHNFKQKLNYDELKQNDRLSLAIKKSSPTINSKILARHSKKDEQDAIRIARFKTDPDSRKKVLKCQYSIQKIINRQRKKQQTIQSRTRRFDPISRFSERKSQKKQISLALPRSTSHKKQIFLTSESTARSNRYKGVISHHAQKVRQHFSNNENRYLTEQKLQGFRQKSPSKQNKMLIPQIHRWKTRCFTSQMQECP